MSPWKMINLFQDVTTKFIPKKCELWVDMSPRIMRTRFQDHLQFSWSIGHSWSQKITMFWGPKYVLYVRIIKTYIHFFSLSTHPVSSVFSVVVRIYKILVIDERFFLFPSITMESDFFSVPLWNTETNTFNTIIQLLNPNYAWKIESNNDYSIKIVAMVCLLSHC